MIHPPDMTHLQVTYDEARERMIGVMKVEYTTLESCLEALNIDNVSDNLIECQFGEQELVCVSSNKESRTIAYQANPVLILVLQPLLNGFSQFIFSNRANDLVTKGSWTRKR